MPVEFDYTMPNLNLWTAKHPITPDGKKPLDVVFGAFITYVPGMAE